MGLQITLTSYSTYQERLIALPWTLLLTGQTSRSLIKKNLNSRNCWMPSMQQMRLAQHHSATCWISSATWRRRESLSFVANEKYISLCHERTIRCYLTWWLQVDRSFFCFSDLDPCLNVNCPSFGVCKTYSAHEARCVCFDDCPTYQDPVCTANGTTYDNKCWHELSYCRGLDNNLVYHPGSCEGWWERPPNTVVEVMKMNWRIRKAGMVDFQSKSL